MKKFAVTLVAVITLFGTAACGDKTEKVSQPVKPQAVETTQAAPVVYNESDILDWIGAKNSVYTTPDGVKCEIAVVMTNREMVSMYADAGDVVAPNADGTAGVKITSPEAATCQQVITERLAGFPDGEKPVSEEAAVDKNAQELQHYVQLYSDLFLNGQGSQSYVMFSNRCFERTDRNQYIAASAQAKQMYGPMEMKSYDAEISGNMARVTYTYPVPALDQQQEPWVYEDGQWRQDDC